MNAEDVLKLVNAGFNKEEIMALSVSNPAPAKEEPAKEQTPAEVPVEEVKKNSPSSEDVLNRINDLEKMIQANNRQNAVIDTPKPETTEDIFKSIFGLEIDK